MWFRRKPKPDRWTVAGQRARRRASVLNVSTRLSHSRGAAWHRVAALVLVPVTLAAAVLLAWFGLDRVGRVLFAENPRARYLVGTRWEGSRVLEALMERLLDANDCPTLGLSLDELMAMLRARAAGRGQRS